jgi:hypothetical protein
MSSAEQRKARGSSRQRGGPKSARQLKHGIKLTHEEVLKGTGHLMRFTHETLYIRGVDRFLLSLNERRG